MKQGNKQALFYQMRASVNKETSGDQETMVLLDGWFTHFRILAELLTVMDVSPMVFTFFLTQKHLFEQITSTVDTAEPVPAFTTEDAFTIHGLPDLIPYAVLLPLSMLANGWFEANIFQRFPVHAAHDITVKLKSETLGTANNTGEVDALIELKQVISPTRWK